ncbi:single-stranded DNA-binding protein [Clostridium saccharobutylicum]|uniref:single-stranded DNA-binding protein n=1 Tax=Clostridium saccharobutylicum TaxID=169679 RepID=UPI0009839390|nr:single-stranded DNA-binding protein [Clostridium saccharobutylicum]AQS08850.1 single-stranded DNA-binding protein [Clostridium saccharobutylicum]MBC2437774.1 single-stranded DNA-binding protein [Clostridium saccharobutylicum]NSB90198.1 single-strand DNA-binding protein [Clostridium saccharobutylicum]NYC28802.1 single-strand DNA-binding protein [Clostridium saccharobutylicum]OOM14731.1 single-stranded DNA-binding protein [Clostridium saccharobutylicum]
MAMQNTVQLLGNITEILNEDKTKFKLSIKKNDTKFVYPVIKLSKQMEYLKNTLEIGKTILLEGKIFVEQENYTYICPCCNKLNETSFHRTTILATKAFIVTTEDKEPYLNKILLIGSLCSNPQLKYIPGKFSQVPNAKYQIATKRICDGTDFPWIVTFARQAEEDMKRLKTSSQVMVDGAILTRPFKKKFQCEHCKKEHNIEDTTTEIHGLKIEYLNNCNFDEFDNIQSKSIFQKLKEFLAN